MKSWIVTGITCALFAGIGIYAFAQPDLGSIIESDLGRFCGVDRDGHSRGGPPEPYTQMFDSDQDGIISADEIANASVVLAKYDRNDDGKLTREELPRGRQRPSHHANHHSPQHSLRRPPLEDKPSRDSDRANSAKQGVVTLNGGFETDPVDGGRPVALIAAALGVKTTVFREAFSNVRPARGGAPSESRQRANKEVLMDALSKYGITNERLDEVSNYYRYRPETGSIWRHQEATVEAIIDDGNVVGFKILDQGSGYLTPPQVRVKGYEDVRAEAKIAFAKDLSKNGRIVEIVLSPKKPE